MYSTNAKYNHVFAIVRVDTFQEEAPLEEKIAITKVVSTQEAAEQEVKRLNELNGPKGCLYFWQITRMGSCAESVSGKPLSPSF